MFYSQFILAKKGPLGTIWIAAHLERKLRKNQVADTDIGVSVDSILFPEVPIALRLSSHLLLGVVRIYSRKVNYLFHDCSEALLKIKQAFRSTAVDLPPEESTAPYHSITLPETFDLDDFELPDNALFQGNFVDHHVSTREQITLQDNMDGMAFPTSQFGPDERFGDGDTSQIGLDLDEELLMEKFASTGRASVSLNSKDVDHLTSSCPKTSSTLMEVDCIEETSKELSEPFASPSRSHVDSNVQYSMVNDDSACLHGDHIQTPDLNEELLPCGPIGGPSAVDFPVNVTHVSSSDSVDCAQAPSTPGLIEGAIAAGVHEVPLLSLLRKKSLHNSVEGLSPEGNEANHFESLDFDPTEPMPDEHLGSPLEDLDSHAEETNHMDGVLNCTSLDVHPTQKIENGSSSDALQDYPADRLVNGEASVQTKGHLLEPVGEVNSPNSALLSNAGSHLKSVDGGDIEKVESEFQVKRSEISEVGSMPEHFEHGDHADASEDPHANIPVLQACSLSSNQPNGLPMEDFILVENIPKLSSTEVGSSTSLETEGKVVPDISVSSDEMRGEGSPGAVMVSNIGTEAELLLPENGEGCDELDGSLNDIPSKNTQTEASKSSETQMESSKNSDTQIEASESAELSAPERLLSAPEGVSELPDDLLVQSTSDKEAAVEDDGTIDRFQSLSGRKRSLTESTLVMENSTSAKLSGMSRYKRSTEYVPEDDDLLASILVGRRTSSLKIKSTPEVGSSKCPRRTPKTYVSKRKALMDDTMVLSGDEIRQQLTIIEDIRRTRRKAPCTHHEIWMIQNNLLEEEIFSEPLFTGVSAGLTGLQKQTYHKPKTGPALADSNNSVGAAKRLELSGRTSVSEETSLGVMDGLVAMPEKNDTESKGHTEAISQIKNQSEPPICSQQHDTEEQMFADAPQPDSPDKGQSQDPVAMEIDSLERGERNEFLSAEKNNKNEAVLVLERGEGNESLCAEKNNQSEAFLVLERGESNASPSAEKNNDDEPVLENEALCLSPGHGSVIQFDEKPVEVCDEILLPEDLYIVKDASTKETAAAIANDLKDQTVNQGVNASVAAYASITDINGVISIEAAQPSLPQGFHIGGDGMLGDCLLETGMDILTDSMNAVGDSAPFPDSIVEIGKPGDINDSLERVTSTKLENGIEGELVTKKVTNGENHSSDLTLVGFQEASGCPLQLDGDSENLPVEGQEHLDCQGVDHETVVDARMPPAEYCDDFDHMLDENDTDFLNVDDDDDDEPVEGENDNMPITEEGRFVENSGWSSRTRAVARYLQSSFEKEAGRGRKYVAMDNLLFGKTRKEASRMFFETLVLKTKDYIQVEQPNTLDNINVLPTTKLMKLEF